MLQQLSRISVVITAMLLSMSIDAGPIHDAAKQGNVEEIKVLLDNGADVNAEAITGSTPLHLAAEEGHESVVQVLLENGADLNIQDNDGDTPAALARKNGHREVLQVMWNSLRVKEENLAKLAKLDNKNQDLAKSECKCVLAVRVRAKMLQKQRKGQFTATDAGAHIKH